MTPKIGISIDRYQIQFGLMTALEIAKEIGADAVDIMINHEGHEVNSIDNPNSIYSKGDEAIIAYFTKVKERADELGLIISQTHGRMVGFTLDPEHNKLTLENARIDCMVTAVLGAKVCVMHGPSPKRLAPDTTTEQFRKVNLEMFEALIPYAVQYGIEIGTETLGDTPEEYLIKFQQVRALEHAEKAFSMCMDVGHSNTALKNRDITIGDVIRMYGKNISCLHLHDNNGLKDQHKMPGTGDIDWKDLLSALKEVGYQGVYNLEIKLEEFGWDLIIPYGKFAIEVMRGMLAKH